MVSLSRLDIKNGGGTIVKTKCNPEKYSEIPFYILIMLHLVMREKTSLKFFISCLPSVIYKMFSIDIK